ncbi:MAG: hypothetical protein IPN47_22180 [Gemmatimonadetes bacterium]|nr:hypothetical protein [Gemmatimonadota bacterium]
MSPEGVPAAVTRPTDMVHCVPVSFTWSAVASKPANGSLAVMVMRTSLVARQSSCVGSVV